MLTLDEALALLDEDDVDEIIVQSGQAVRTLKGFTERAVPGGIASASEIVGILQAAQLQELVPRHDTAGEEHTRSVDGRPYRFRIARFLDLIELRISPASDEDLAPRKAVPPGSSEDTVIVTAPKGPARGRPPVLERRGAKLGRVQREYAVPLPPPTRVPIGTDEPTTGKVPQPDTPTRREIPLSLPAEVRAPPVPSVGRGVATPDAGPPTRRDTPLVEPAPARPRPSTEPSLPAQEESPPAPRPVPAAAAAPAPVPAPIPAPIPVTVRPSATQTAAVHDATGTSLSPALAKILAAARVRGASDVHFVSGQAPRLRIAGRLAPDGAPVSNTALADAVDGLLAEHQLQLLDERGYADLGFSDPSAGRLRLNVCRHRTGLKLCVRLVAAHPATPTDLGLPWEVEAIANHHQGLVVCSGPSGAGKSTTMAALVNLFNERRAVHIITVEDPVEIAYPRAKAVVSQREVGTHTLSFANALKAALREDPDIIGIGELRDRETVAMALSAAETGHLVVATMSTPSGAQTISRLIDMFPPDEQNQVRATLAGALKLVVSQRLIESAEGDRQVAAFEVVTGNVPLWSLIRDHKLHQLPSLLQRGRAYGMVRLEDSLRGLMLSQAITRQAALAHADDPMLLGVDEGGAPPSRRARAGSR